MQTFLPYSDFIKTAKALDNRRLGKQRVEAMQILMVLTGLNKGKGWINHPAVKMWKGYELALAEYAYAICDEWTSKGYKDTCREKVKNIVKDCVGPVIYPAWIGNEDFHKAHRSNLMRKDKQFYFNKFGDIADDLPYLWP
jgi:hypothetical protein